MRSGHFTLGLGSCARVLSVAVLIPVALGCGLEREVERNAEQGILRFEILEVESPTFEGRTFAEVGQYEKIFARAYGQVDPSDPRNAVITDIHLAPHNSNGMVEYSTDVHIIKPVDMSRGNQGIFYNVNNRGNKTTGVFHEVGGNNPTTAADGGNWLADEPGLYPSVVRLGRREDSTARQSSGPCQAAHRAEPGRQLHRRTDHI